MSNKVSGMNLRKQAPRSPRERVGGYVILGRTIDKCRALIAGDIGEFHYDCPLDNILFGWKGINGDELKAEVERGASDEEIARWVDSHGTPKSEEEKQRWSEEAINTRPYNNPERRDWFAEQVKPFGLDPANTTLFDWLEADDKTIGVTTA